MANSKISALTSASTPLAGTETLPIVQSSATKQVSVANLTANRDVSVSRIAAGVSAPIWPADIRGSSGVGISFLETSSGNTTRTQLGTGAGFGFIDATAGSGSVYLSLQAGSVEYAKLDQSGNLTVKSGNLIQGTAAKGVNFTANTPAAGMTSQLLNWYEEGTWTPTISSSAGSITTYTSSGNYTRIGNIVTVTAKIDISNIGTASGYANIGGLPFNVKTGIAGTPFIVMEYVNTGNTFRGILAAGASTGSITTLTNGNLTWANNNEYIFTTTYPV